MYINNSFLKHTILLVFFCGIIPIPGCQDPCGGPYTDREVFVKTIKLTHHSYNGNGIDSLEFTYLTAPFDIQIVDSEPLSENRNTEYNFSFTPTAKACDPIIIISRDKIDSIQAIASDTLIFSNDTIYPNNDISKYLSPKENRGISINNYLSQNAVHLYHGQLFELGFNTSGMQTKKLKFKCTLFFESGSQVSAEGSEITLSP